MKNERCSAYEIKLFGTIKGLTKAFLISKAFKDQKIEDRKTRGKEDLVELLLSYIM